MASSSDFSGDSISPSETSRIERHPSRTGAPTSPIQSALDRVYEVQNAGAFPLFAGGAVALCILFAVVFFFILRSDDVEKLRNLPSFLWKEPSSLTRPRISLPGPVLNCYYDPAWSNATQRGAWVYNLTQHFHTEQCTHAVFVGVRYDYRGILLPRYVSGALPNFLNLKRDGLKVLVSVMVPDVPKASADPDNFGSTVVGWAVEQKFDGVELDLDEDTSGKGYDVLVKAASVEMARFSSQDWVLSANIYMRPSFINNVDLKKLHRDTDFLVLNTQQLSNSDQVTAAHSPLYGKNSWNQSLGEVYARTGTLSRLIPVVPFVSREFELRPYQGAPRIAAGIACRGLAARTQYHSTPGTRAFFEVCQMLEDSSWFKAWQEDEYLYMMAKELQFIVIESKESVICKMQFVKAHHLLGVALKQQGLDAFRAPSECGTQEALFGAVVTEFRDLEASGDKKIRWDSAGPRITAVLENGKIRCVGTAHQGAL